MKMLPAQVVIEERRRAGRPRRSDDVAPNADVHLTLPPEEYDAVDAIAKRERISIQQVIRRGLKRELKAAGAAPD
ncbi:hypothetical protein UFOVP998_29 [uncultured Caudovirales phage]|uniref:Ribbon-helix-helix protein CopG domain-containing protein n=1 Tax=uncultured Caudovirales phage TaxID=2100421 RepID=A0A6J5SGU2_9CAUD|nr:hypothetical protein UFOVP998_29 [uncultured Caudovirales phage]CAB4199234.1 hypothetical protein UFOVP1331_30 [uncultured Caudovirales phage]CAB4213028.1 hypothetical protein UFOVP1442_45 [uncultured Caudovirales phage]CAB5227946.1 hypothetical protein UFOVP1535_6 [uncultured Caudovirales phage]